MLLLVLFFASGCSTAFKPKSLGEMASGYTYVPLDPFPVQTVDGSSCIEGKSNLGSDFNNKKIKGSTTYRALLDALPDNAVRISIEDLSRKGDISYGAGALSGDNAVSRVTVDYTNSDTASFEIWIWKQMVNKETQELEYVHLLVDSPDHYDESAFFEVSSDKPNDDKVLKYAKKYNVPIYIGVGVRVSAKVELIKGEANISGLGAIGASVEEGKVRGTLVVQTLGINGQAISAAVPIQSELNKTTIQNAVASIGAIKALLFEDDTGKSPRVVGMYLPIPGGQALVNAIYTELSNSSQRIKWYRPCTFEDLAS